MAVSEAIRVAPPQASSKEGTEENKELALRLIYGNFQAADHPLEDAREATSYLLKSLAGANPEFRLEIEQMLVSLGARHANQLIDEGLLSDNANVSATSGMVLLRLGQAVMPALRRAYRKTILDANNSWKLATVLEAMGDDPMSACMVSEPPTATATSAIA